MLAPKAPFSRRPSFSSAFLSCFTVVAGEPSDGVVLGGGLEVCDLGWYIPEGSQHSETRVPGGLPALVWPSYTRGTQAGLRARSRNGHRVLTETWQVTMISLFEPSSNVKQMTDILKTLTSLLSIGTFLLVSFSGGLRSCSWASQRHSIGGFPF